MNERLIESDVQWLLDELCLRLGYCLQPAQQAMLRNNPPLSANAFVDAVLVAEGLQPELVGKERRRQIMNIVSAVFAC
ncbi:MAG: hypothetical protein OSA97_16260 [Nevskia sp.]|nr:hypothetical protein [Nevskia sp.]